MKFYIVDAFTNTLFGGNPAGVVIMEKDAEYPKEEILRKTAAELRYSETAFIKPLGKNEFQIRYFTPASEVDLCGHATIGSFFALSDAGLVSFDSSCICHTLAGRLNIDLSDDTVLMDMGTAKALDRIEREDLLKELYQIMGLPYSNQGEVLINGKIASALIPEIVSTGLPDILLPVRNESELSAISPDFSALTELSRKYEVVGVHAFTVNTSDGLVHCRNFAPLYDIDEEAATGTSNGALTYYLYRNGLISEGEENLFIQGEAMKRPSKIRSRLCLKPNGEIKIQIGGAAVILASGEIHL